MTNMVWKRNLTAEFYDFSSGGVTTQTVRDEQDAVQIGLSKNFNGFKTHVQTSVNDGRERPAGGPGDSSGWRFLNVDRLYTRDEVLAQCAADMRSLPMDSYMTPTAIAVQMEGIKNNPETTRYIPDPVRPGDFIPLGRTDKAFNGKGVKIWPLTPDEPADPLPPPPPCL